MQRTRALAVVAATLLLVSLTAKASFSDTFGVYFNTSGTTVSRATPIGTTAVNAYLLLVETTTAVKGFELAYRIPFSLILLCHCVAPWSPAANFCPTPDSESVAAQGSRACGQRATPPDVSAPRVSLR